MVLFVWAVSEVGGHVNRAGVQEALFELGKDNFANGCAILFGLLVFQILVDYVGLNPFWRGCSGLSLVLDGFKVHRSVRGDFGLFQC